LVVSGQRLPSSVNVAGTFPGPRVDGSGAKISNACHLPPSPEEVRRPTVSGTTNIRLRTRASDPTASDSVGSVSVSGDAGNRRNSGRSRNAGPTCERTADSGLPHGERPGWLTRRALYAGPASDLKSITSTQLRRIRSSKARPVRVACGRGRQNAETRS
jgi:hypothetical protein